MNTVGVLLLSLLVAQTSMSQGVASVATGCVVAAPHEGFDSHTGPLARELARRLGAGWVVAKGYRETRVERWLDVNRPTQRRWTEGGRPGKREETELGRATYREYQRRVFEAGAREPLDLLVEIHGHARRTRIGGESQVVQVIELATRGWDDEALRVLKAEYARLQAELPAGDRVPLVVEQLDPNYTYRGEQLTFYFRASGAKRRGSLQEACARRALHFELPPRVRFQVARRARYVELLADLLRPWVRP